MICTRYPKDSEKNMLARQTGLTKTQVSFSCFYWNNHHSSHNHTLLLEMDQVTNWFINARVRLWKPMVEEMYKEEAGNSSYTPWFRLCIGKLHVPLTYFLSFCLKILFNNFFHDFIITSCLFFISFWSSKVLYKSLKDRLNYVSR